MNPVHKIISLLVGLLLTHPGFSQSGQSIAFNKDKFTGVYKLQIGLEGSSPTDNSNYQPSYFECELGKTILFRMYSIANLSEKDSSGQKGINNRFLNNYKIVFPDFCNSSNDASVLSRMGGPPAELYRLENGFKVAEIRYKINNYGRAKIYVGHAVVKHGSSPAECDQQKVFEIVINKPTLPINEQWAELEAGGAASLCGYLSNNPNGMFAYRANNALTTLITTDWTTTKSKIGATQDRKERLVICNRFLEKYAACPASLDAIKAAKGLKEDIAAILKQEQANKTKESSKEAGNSTGSKEPISKEKEAWLATANSHDLAKYNKFLENFPQSQYTKLAKDSLIRLSPINVSAPEEDADGKITLKFTNIVQPTYNAVGLDVQFQTPENQLIISFFKPNGKFDIEVIDKKYPWKKVIQHVDNLFVPSLSLEKDKLILHFKGGVKPYKVALIDPGSLVSIWSQNGITSASKEFSFRELKHQGLLGTYLVQVADASIPASVINLKDPLIIPYSYAWVVLLCIGVLGGLAALVYYGRKYGRKKDTNIFNT